MTGGAIAALIMLILPLSHPKSPKKSHASLPI
jgi:hypothetical protein